MAFIKRNLMFIVLFILLGGLLIVATFFDLDISKAIASLEGGVYYSDNSFAVFFECFGEMPVYILPSLGLGCLFFYVKKSQIKNSTKYLLMAAMLVAAIGLNYYGSHKLIKYWNIHISPIYFEGIIKTLIEAALGVMFTAIWFFLTSLIKDKYLKSLAICSLIVVFTALLSQGLTQAIKPLFGRARYRLMNLTEDFSEFTNWYQINIGKTVSAKQLAMGAESDGYKSFPSGHTTAAAILFALLCIPEVFNLSSTKKWAAALFVTICVFTVAYSRIVMGAHYLSDITVGAAITLISYLAVKNIVYKILDKKPLP